MWREVLLKHYHDHEVWQHLLMMCHEMIGDGCGGERDFYSEYYYDLLIDKTRTFLDQEVVTRRQWLRRLMDISLPW